MISHVTGIDLSLTATGVSTLHLDSGTWKTVTFKPPSKLDGLDRMDWITDRVLAHCFEGELAVMEGPAFGAAGRGQHERGGLWWIVLRLLRNRRSPTAVAPPTNVKKYATGKGGASKDEVMLHTARRFPAFDGDNNAADALWLAAMGAEHLNRAIVALPTTHRAALKGVAWPQLPGDQ